MSRVAAGSSLRASLGRSARISGGLLLATGAVHTLIGVVSGAGVFRAMLQEGVVRTVTTSEREAAFWFTVTGVSLLLTGGLAVGYGRPLPAGFGWGLLGLSAAGVLFLGGSGFVLVLPQAIYILLAARRGEVQCRRRRRIVLDHS